MDIEKAIQFADTAVLALYGKSEDDFSTNYAFTNTDDLSVLATLVTPKVKEEVEEEGEVKVE